MIARLLISPSRELIKKEIKQSLASHLTSGNLNHPDLLYFPSDSKLGIAESRKIKEHFSLKPYSAKGRIVVLEDATALTAQAQNALLKTLEELPIESLLLMGSRSEASFLPTILSRCQIISLYSQQSEAQTTQNISENISEIEKLVSNTLVERFDYVEKCKNKEELLHNLISYFHQNLSSNLKGSRTNSIFLKELLQAEEWVKQNVNIRAILEYLMLVMPDKK